MFIDVHFSEPLTVAGEPRLAFEMGSEMRHTKFNGLGDDGTLWFGYTVQSEDTDADGISVAADAIDLNGATVQDFDGNDAVLDLGEHARENHPELTVDGSISNPPLVTGLWLHGEPIDGVYALGERIGGRLGFSKPVSVNGDPKVRIGVGDHIRLADIQQAQGQMWLDFDYVVEAGDKDEDGISIADDAIDLNGGLIRDASGNDLVTNIGDHAIDDDDRHRVDGSLDRQPFVEWVWVREPAEDPFVAGDRIEIHVNFSEALVVNGAPRLALEIGSETRYAEYQWQDVSKLGFAYEVVSEDLDEDGLSIPSDAIDLNGATIQDRAGQDALLDLGENARVDDPSLKVDGSLDRPVAVANVSFHTRPQDGETYFAGERVEVGVDFSKDVVLTPQYWMGSLQLALTIGDEIRHADNFWHDGRRSTVFTYEITTDDVDADGITVAANALTLNDTTISDANGNAVELDLGEHAIVDAPNQRVDGSVTDTAPAVRLVTFSGRPGGGTAYGTGEAVRIDVWFTKNVQVTGDVRLALNIGDQVRHAKPLQGVSCPGGGNYCRSVRFDYLVQADDSDADGISIAANALVSHGGWIRDRYGNDANLGLDGFEIDNDASQSVDGSVDPPPRVSFITSSATVGNSPVPLNDLFVVWVGFSEPVVVKGTPMLSVDIGGKMRRATYGDLQTLSGFGWDLLGFTYQVMEGDSDDDGLSLPGTVLELIGGSVEDYAGNPAQLDLANAPIFGLPNLRVDGERDDIGPIVSGLTVSGMRSGNTPVSQRELLRQNDTLIVSVVFDEYIESDDTLTLNIWIGDRPVSMQSYWVRRFGQRQIDFRYVIQPEDSGDLAITRDALTLAPGAGLRDGAGNAAELDLGDYSVPGGTSYRVAEGVADSAPAVAFAVSNYSFSPHMGSWGEGERLRVIVNFDEPVLVDESGGSPVLRLQLGTQARSFQYAGYADRLAHRSDLAFDYYVQPSDFFLASGDAQLLLNGAIIKDATGNNAMLDFPATNLFWPRVDGEAPPSADPRIESKSFPQSEFSSERGPDRSFGANEFIDIPLYFSEPVAVTGEPTLPFQVGAAERRAWYIGGSGTRQLLFRYRVVASDVGPVELHKTEVELNGGTIRGLDGDSALLEVRSNGFVASQFYFANGLRVPDNANAVAVPVANLPDASLRGAVVQALGKLAGTAVTRSELSDLTTLAAPDSGISDLTGLELATNLEELDLAGNAVSDLSPLAGLNDLERLDLSNNAIRDIEPLLANSGLGAGDTVYLHGNPLSAESIETHIPALRDRGVTVYHVDLSIMAASAHEGESLEFTVRLSLPAANDVEVDWEAAGGVSEPAVEGDDFPSGESGTLVIPAGDDSGTLTVFTNADQAEETHETLQVRLTEVSGGLPEGVVLVGREAPGLIVEPGVPAADVPVFAAADHANRQGFVRVINLGPRGAVHIDALDDQGNRRSISLDIAAGGTVHFNSNDLENGNVGKGLTRGVGTGTGNWRLELSGIDVRVLAYMRTGDGFLTSLHDLVPAEEDGYRVPIFNPGSNMDQVSSLRVFNANEQDAALTVTATDDRGMASAGDVQLQLAAGEARTISAADLESGAGLSGALGDGAGKWELLVDSDQPVGLASLLESPTGHLTNLSTWADNSAEGPDGTTHHVLLFPSASDANDRQGFLRIVNRGPAGTVSIKAYDDFTWDYDPVTMELQAGQTIHFNSNDLEFGNDAKGLPVGVGMGSGDWRLELTSELDLDVLAYIRRINDGFLTGMHDTVPLIEDVYAVPTFNPGRNRNQVSLLRLVNPGGNAAEVTIRGVDDAGVDASGAVRLTVPARSVRTVSAQELEVRSPRHAGALGRGQGKWRLAIESDQPIQIISLLQSPTGHLTNLSTWPDQER